MSFFAQGQDFLSCLFFSCLWVPATDISGHRGFLGTFSVKLAASSWNNPPVARSLNVCYLGQQAVPYQWVVGGVEGSFWFRNLLAYIHLLLVSPAPPFSGHLSLHWLCAQWFWGIFIRRISSLSLGLVGSLSPICIWGTLWGVV